MARQGRLAPKAIAGTGMLDPGTSADTETEELPRLQVAPSPAHAAGPPVSAAPAPAAPPPAAPEAGQAEAPGLDAGEAPGSPAAPPESRTWAGRSESARQQVTVMVSADVRDRFDEWRDLNKLKNTAVAARALNAADAAGNYAALVMARRPQPEPGARFGAPVPGRRMTTVRNRSVQLSLYLLPAELDDLDGIVASVPDANRSELLDAVLDEFLPSMADIRRSARRSAS